MSSLLNGFGPFFETKKLKALFVNRLLDIVSRDFVRRVLIRSDSAHCAPRLELARQLSADQIATECAQVGIRFRPENENPHRSPTPAIAALVVVERIL
jgi:hypothetical protein